MLAPSRPPASPKKRWVATGHASPKRKEVNNSPVRDAIPNLISGTNIHPIPQDKRVAITKGITFLKFM